MRIALTRDVPATAAALPMLAIRVHSAHGVTRSIEIRLDPPELGIVNVRLETGRDGKLTAVLSAERGDAFNLLKGESAALEAALRDAGVELGEDGISFEMSDSGRGSGGAGTRNEAYADSAGRNDAAIDEAVLTTTPGWRNGVIDISV